MKSKLDIAEAEVLNWLTQPVNRDTRIDMMLHAVTGAAGYGVRWKSNRGEAQQALWSLISKRMAYIEMSQPSASNWSICLTERGANAADRTKINPDNDSAYIAEINKTIPQFSETASLYLQESLTAFSSECYLASTMMLGVATEACFYDIAGSFAKWLGTVPGQQTSSQAFSDLLEQPTRAYVHKFAEFQKRLLSNKGHLQAALQQNLDLNINAAIELIRIARNEVGHPTNQGVSRESANQYLLLFPMLAKRLYELKRFFESTN